MLIVLDKDKLIAKLTDALLNMIDQHCGMNTDPIEFDSKELTANNDAMKLLVKLDKLEIIAEKGRLLITSEVKK